MKKNIFLTHIFLFFTITGLFGHPHMFMESSLEFIWNKEKLSGVYVEWIFDQFFSADIINAWDENFDGKFNKTETQNVYNNAFINLQHYYYFTFIRQQSTRYNPEKTHDFSVWQNNGIMHYKFYVDLSSFKEEEIFIAIYDYTFFCDIAYSKTDPVKLTYDPKYVKPKFSIIENKDYPVYYNPMGAIDDTTIYYEYKKGLQTYYPKEIKIFYE